ncbi:PAS domain-containing protein [Salinigranum marinum]|uniref:PAS domain-containing protein n=1 Tax=Salinigranum marinum TaxID=1515595 RepID=UPI002989BC20|nr:PAS domain-containing protein [Salinigranum marinum]
MSTDTPRPPAAGRSDGRPIRVLHVDDDRPFTAITAEFLSGEDDRFVVRSDVDAAAALDRLATEAVDCVVSDYEMPGMDGLAFLSRVRERWPDLPFVLFTGRGSEEVAAEAISAGVSDYLQKGGTDRYPLLATRITTLVEKYRLTQELATTRRRYELVGRVAADAFFEWDVRSDAVWRSDGYARVFGYDADEVGDSFDWLIERLHPDDRERVAARLDATFSAGSDRYEDRFRFRLGDGSYGHVSARAHVAYDDGEPTTVTGALTDRSESRQRERELERANARLELALEGTETGVWEWDVGTDEVVWDGTMERLFGFGAGEFAGTRGDYLDRIHPDDRPSLERAIGRAVETGETYEVEHRLRPDLDEPNRWINGKGVVVSRDGRPNRVIGLARDVTERRWNEAELQRQNERLNEFASVVSHDLRSPLAVATGHLDLIRTVDLASMGHRAAVARAHDRMHALTSDLLTLARQGETIANPEPVSLSTVADTAWSMVDTGDATLAVDDAVVFADERRLGQVFENLFRNAVEHGSTGPRSQDRVEHGSASNRTARQSGGSVEDGSADDRPSVSIRVGLLSGSELTDQPSGFFVADDGLGIPESDRGSVFAPGFTTSAAGTGFGLAIVYRIAAAHGWAISVTESDVGGARFEFVGVDRPHGRGGSPS